MKDKEVDWLPPELEVPPGDLLQNVHGNKPELTEDNFAKLCQKVTELQTKRRDRLEKIDNKLNSMSDKAAKLERKLDNTDKVVDDIHEIRNDLEDTARVLALMKVEASELQHLESK